MSKKAHFSVTALSEAAGGDVVPTLPVTLAYVAACGGDNSAWEERWRQLMAELVPAEPPTGNETPSVATYPWLVAFETADGARYFEHERGNGLRVSDPPRRPAAWDGPDRRASAVPVPRELPATVSPFVGRQAERVLLDRLRADGRSAGPTVVIVTGTAGVGKTALAVRWAHRVTDRHPDGQLFVDLQGYSPDRPLRALQALTHLLHSLGVDGQQVPAQERDAAALYRSLVARRRLLVVLDNAVSAAQVRPLLPGGAGCLVVVTSRDRLDGLVARDGAHRVDLDMLTPVEATTLLGEVVGAARVAAEPEAAAELARLCAGLPLALRIVAADLAGHAHRSLADQVAQLSGDRRLGALVVAGDPQTAARYAFDLSYQAVSAPARRLFRFMGLHLGPDLTVDAATVLAGTADVAGPLGELVRAHLVEEATAGRYRSHDLLRDYARERVAAEESEQERDTALRRLYDWYLGKAQAADRLLHPQFVQPSRWVPPVAVAGFDTARQARGWLRAERANLVVACSDAAGHGLAPYAWPLADTLRGFLLRRRNTVEWFTVGDADLAAPSLGDALGTATPRVTGNPYDTAGQYREAVGRMAEAGRLAEQADWPEGVAGCLGARGLVHRLLGELDEAVRCQRRALEICRQVELHAVEAVTCHNLGCTYQDMGQLTDARDCYARALDLYRAMGSPAPALCVLNVAATTLLLGDLDAARTGLEHTLATARATGYPTVAATALLRLADLAIIEGALDNAAQAVRDARAEVAGLDEWTTEVDALTTTATIRYARSEHQQSIDDLTAALDLAERITLPLATMTAHIGLAAAHAAAGRLPTARTHTGLALATAEPAGYRLHEGHARTVLARVELAAGNRAAAAAQAHQAVLLHQQTGHQLGKAQALTVLGEAADDPQAARAPDRAVATE